MIHVPPSDLAREHGLDLEQLLDLCTQLSVPVIHGRIDKTLFELAMNDARPEVVEAAAKRSPEPLRPL